MPVEFSKLPPQQPIPENPPSRWLWTVVFSVMVIVGIFAVLLLWPKGNLPQQKFALWGIVKILKNVAGTTLEYKT